MTENERRPGYPGEKARQGDIILNTPARRWIFFGGWIGLSVLFLLGVLLLVIFR